MQGALYGHKATAVGAARYRFGVDAYLVPLVIVAATIIYSSNFVSMIQTFLIGDRIPAVERIAYLTFYAATLALCLRRARSVVRAMAQSPAMLLMLALPVISVLWSVDRGETTQRLIAFIGTTMLGVYVGATLSLRRMVILFGVGFAVLAFMNLGAVALFSEARGDVTFPDSWRGFNFQKNALGRNSLIGVLICSFAALETRGRLRALLIAGALVSVLLIANTSSRTTLGVLTVGAGLAAAGVWMRRAAGLWLYSALIAVAALTVGVWMLFASGVAETLLNEFGRNATLSGRVYIWDFAWSYIKQRPWLGYGYWVFWDPESIRYRLFADLYYFEAVYSHNGYIEILLMTGLIGLVSFILVVLIYIRNSIFIIWKWPMERLIVLMIVFIIIYLIANITESRFFLYNDLPWVLFIGFSLSLSQMARSATLPTPRPLAASLVSRAAE